MTIKEQIKKVLIEDLALEDVEPDDIKDDAPLFGEGLGLDSLDAVELAMIIKKRFGVEIADMTEGRRAFESVNALNNFIEERLSQQA